MTTRSGWEFLRLHHFMPEEAETNRFDLIFIQLWVSPGPPLQKSQWRWESPPCRGHVLYQCRKNRSAQMSEDQQSFLSTQISGFIIMPIMMLIFPLLTPRTISLVEMNHHIRGKQILWSTKTDLDPVSFDRVPETYIYYFTSAEFSCCEAKINEHGDVRVWTSPPTTLFWNTCLMFSGAVVKCHVSDTWAYENDELCLHMWRSGYLH